MTISNRVAAIERSLTRRAAPQVIEVRGGFSDESRMRATAGEFHFKQTESETPAAFRARALTAATAAGKPFLIIAGLPGEH
jgi:hypothetical protein